MQTINISLPESLATQVETVIEKEGYASRSEFFRALLRFYLYSAGTITTHGEIVLTPFMKKPLVTIEEELTSTGKYNRRFIQSVVSGLRKSSLYSDEN